MTNTQEYDDVVELEESISGSAWMFYNHYNPDLLNGLQKVLAGSRVESVVDNLLEVNKLAVGGALAATAVGAGLGYLRGTGRGPRKHKSMKKSAENWRQGSKAFRDKAKTETDPKKKERWLAHSRSAKTAHKHMKAKAKAYKKYKVSKYDESVDMDENLKKLAALAKKSKAWKNVKAGAKHLGSAAAQAMDPQKNY